MIHFDQKCNYCNCLSWCFPAS